MGSKLEELEAAKRAVRLMSPAKFCRVCLAKRVEPAWALAARLTPERQTLPEAETVSQDPHHSRQHGQLASLRRENTSGRQLAG